MSATSVIVSFGVAALLLLLGGLLVYMTQLIKNAYQIKVELQSELDAGLRRVDEEADKKLKWIKRDMFEELEKAKNTLNTESARKLSEVQELFAKRLQERDDVWKRDRLEMIKVIEQQRENIKMLDQRLRTLRRDQRRIDMVPLPETAAGGNGSEPPGDAGQLAQLPPPTEVTIELPAEEAQKAEA